MLPIANFGELPFGVTQCDGAAVGEVHEEILDINGTQSCKFRDLPTRDIVEQVSSRSTNMLILLDDLKLRLDEYRSKRTQGRFRRVV